MKKSNYVRLIKLNASSNPLFPTPEMSEYKVGEYNGDVSLPVDYTVEGFLLSDILVGKSVQMDRYFRNGVEARGFLSTSAVKLIKGNTFETANSIYQVENINK